MGCIARKLTVPLVAVAALACGPIAALAATPADVRGTWQGYACVGVTLAECEANPTFPQQYVIASENFETGAITGEEVSGGYKITGTVTGCSVFTHDYAFTGSPGYESEGTAVLSADGTKLRGTFSDTFGRKEQPSFSTRPSGPGCGSEPKKEEPKGARATGTSVICNYELATSEDVCGASVGDGGAGTPLTPTGTVKFTATSGGFSSGASCNLSPTPLSPAVASCTVVFFASEAHLPTVTASYGGDANHSGSTGSTKFLAAGLEEPLLNAAGPSGKYPNELELETEVPVSGTNVETTVGTRESRPQPVPLDQPDPAGLDAQSATLLRKVEALTMLEDVNGLMGGRSLLELNADIERLDSRAAEVAQSTAPSEKAEAQRMIDETNAEIEAITKMEELRNEAAKSIFGGRYPRGLAEADSKVEKVDEKIGELLNSASPADQARAQTDLENVTRSLEEINKALEQHEEVTKQVLKAIKASVARRHGRHISLRSVLPLGRLRARNLAAGKHKLKVKLVASRIQAAARGRKALPVTVRTMMVLPSRLLQGGLPRIVVQTTVLRRR
jgi:hypothetical protein